MAPKPARAAAVAPAASKPEQHVDFSAATSTGAAATGITQPAAGAPEDADAAEAAAALWKRAQHSVAAHLEHKDMMVGKAQRGTLSSLPEPAAKFDPNKKRIKVTTEVSCFLAPKPHTHYNKQACVCYKHPQHMNQAGCKLNIFPPAHRCMDGSSGPPWTSRRCRTHTGGPWTSLPVGKCLHTLCNYEPVSYSALLCRLHHVWLSVEMCTSRVGTACTQPAQPHPCSSLLHNELWYIAWAWLRQSIPWQTCDT
jgi:hypothetical protein